MAIDKPIRTGIIQSAAATTERGPMMKVLVAGADVTTCKLIEEAVSPFGHTVTPTINGDAAWKKFQTETHPIVILDRQLPDMDGLQLCQKIRALPTGKRCVLLIITPPNGTAHDPETLLAGADDYLAKPLDLRDLQVRLNIAQQQAQDRTAHWSTQEKTQRNENLYRDLFDNLGSGVAVYQAIDRGEDFVFRDFNKAAERIEKIGREELIGRSVSEIFPGVKPLGLFDVFQRVWRTGKPERHPQALYKDNRISGWRENYVYKLPSGEIVAAYNDVTAHKESQDQLLFEKSLLESQNEAFPDGILVVSPEGKIISFNNRFIQLWNIPPEIIVSRSDEAALSFVLPNIVDPDAFLARVKHLYENPEEEWTDKIALKEGRIFERYSTPIRDKKGAYYGRIWFFRDITGRR